MESRKRSRAEDSEPVNAKKRLLSDSRESPIPVNGAGHDTDEPKDDDNLEVRLARFLAVFSLRLFFCGVLRGCVAV